MLQFIRSKVTSIFAKILFVLLIAAVLAPPSLAEPRLRHRSAPRSGDALDIGIVEAVAFVFEPVTHDHGEAQRVRFVEQATVKRIALAHSSVQLLHQAPRLRSGRCLGYARQLRTDHTSIGDQIQQRAAP